MERRNLLAGLAVLALSLFLLSGTAFAHATHHKKAKPQGAGDRRSHGNLRREGAAGLVYGPGRVRNASSVADIIEVECEEVYAEKTVEISANELYSRCAQKLYWRTPYGQTEVTVRYGTELQGHARQRRQRHRDRDRRSLVRGRRKPDRGAPGSRSVHDRRPPAYGAAAAADRTGREGRTVEARSRVRNSATSRRSSQVEFPPVFAEEPVNVNSHELYSRCHNSPKTEAIIMVDG